MFELTLLVCAGTYCSVEPTPVAYPTFERCAMAASITMGRVRSKFDRSVPISHFFQCNAEGEDGLWVAFVDGSIVERDPDPQLEAQLRDMGML